jgi:hypothetical protein
MGVFQEVTYTPGVANQENIRIDKNRRHISLKVTMYRLIDTDTKQWVNYVPALDLTSYGATQEKATVMLNSSIDDLFEYLIDLSPKQLNTELSKLGWKQHHFRNKEYSKAYIDINGELKDLNIVPEKVERLTLTAA